MTTGFIKSRRAAVDIAGCLLVAFTATRNQVTVAATATDPLAGISDAEGGKAGGLVDVYLTEIGDLRAGGVISPGDLVTADAMGRGVKATRQAGAVVRYIGVAQGPAVEGDIFHVLIAPGAIHG